MNDPKSVSSLLYVLQSAFPDGITQPIYFSLIAIFLEDNLSETTIRQSLPVKLGASVLSQATDKDSNQILLDIDEIKTHPTNNPDSLLELREQLNNSGYLYLNLLLYRNK